MSPNTQRRGSDHSVLPGLAATDSRSPHSFYFLETEDRKSSLAVPVFCGCDEEWLQCKRVSFFTDPVSKDATQTENWLWDYQ